jgi:hypothetical protein
VSANNFHDLTVNSYKSITISNEDEAVPTILGTEKASREGKGLNCKEGHALVLVTRSFLPKGPKERSYLFDQRPGLLQRRKVAPLGHHGPAPDIGVHALTD